MSQTSYSINMQTAQQGQLADVAKASDIVSGCLTASGEVGVFGTLLMRDQTSGDFDVRRPVAGDASAGAVPSINAFGVVVEAQTIPSNVNSPALQPYYPNKYTVPALRKGRIWVLSEEAVTAGTSTVAVRDAVGDSGSVLGAFRVSAVAAGANGQADLLDAECFRWLTSTTGANALAQLEVNLP